VPTARSAKASVAIAIALGPRVILRRRGGVVTGRAAGCSAGCRGQCRERD
jgi:hypothetical protein